MEKNSFILYTTYAEILQDLSMEEMGYIFKAILDYKANGEISDLPKQLKTIFKFIKNQLDIDNDKWEQIKQARSEAGKKGNEKRWGKSIDNQEENHKNNKGKNVIANIDKQSQSITNNRKTSQNIAKVSQKSHNENDNENVNDNVINNKRENNIKEKSLAVVETTALTPQVEVFNYFAKLYKSVTNIDYLGKGIDYINLAKLIKKYGKALVIQKINWLLVGCKNSVFWFSKDINDFTVSTLTAQWDRILPKLTAEQKKEQEKLKQEQEKKKKLYEALAKQGIVLEDKGNKGGLNVVSR